VRYSENTIQDQSGIILRVKKTQYIKKQLTIKRSSILCFGLILTIKGQCGRQGVPVKP